MKFDVYCDESRPDLLGSDHPQGQFMVIGGLWLPTSERMKSLSTRMRGVLTMSSWQISQ